MLAELVEAQSDGCSLSLSKRDGLRAQTTTWPFDGLRAQPLRRAQGTAHGPFDRLREQTTTWPFDGLRAQPLRRAKGTAHGPFDRLREQTTTWPFDGLRAQS